MIDLRSDTVTKPCAAMRAAMAAAEVGDDVVDVDPTVAALQDRIAGMLGKEAAMFVPSGTMANQIAVRLHCKPGDELICDSDCHIYKYEQGGFSQLSGVVAHTVHSPGHLTRLDDLRDLIHSDDDHVLRTRLVCQEVTHNRGGGRIPDIGTVTAICDWAHENGLATHLDGARLFNAAVASGISLAEWASGFDTVSVCFSKGLGAPVGSALAGSRGLIREMRRHRKLFGGGMRQSGIIAAGALFALENNIGRLAEDHAAARLIADEIRRSPNLLLEPEVVDTNIVIFRISGKFPGSALPVDDDGIRGGNRPAAEKPAGEFCRQLRARGILALPFSRQHVRVVTHKDVSMEDCRIAGNAIAEIARALVSM
jgi:threonine aldolase